MRPSSRLDQIPPYLFAQLERKISEKRAAGIDVISLGIGDPDTPTYAPDRGGGAAGGRRPQHPHLSRPTAAAPSSARRWRPSTRAASGSRWTPRPR